jgi:hypothetical protein
LGPRVSPALGRGLFVATWANKLAARPRVTRLAAGGDVAEALPPSAMLRVSHSVSDQRVRRVTRGVVSAIGFVGTHIFEYPARQYNGCFQSCDFVTAVDARRSRVTLPPNAALAAGLRFRILTITCPARR